MKKTVFILALLFAFSCNRNNSVPKESAFQYREIIPAASDNNKNVMIKVVEVLSMPDFLKNNMNTLSNEKLLESAGMIYVDASHDGKPLAIKNGNALHIEMPADRKAPGYKIFNGQYDSFGNMNWVVNENDSIDEGMIPLPLDLFDYKYYTKYKFTTERNYIWWMDSVQLQNDKKYENTYIATEDFERRFNSMNLNFAWWGEYPDGVWWGEEQADGSIKSNHTREMGKVYDIFHPVLDIYLANIDKPLWYSDSLAYSFLKKKEIHDSVEYYKVNKWNGLNQIWYNSISFNYFLGLHTTFVKKYDPKGVDMTQGNAKELLMQKGWNEIEAYNQMLIYKSRQRIANKREEEKRIAKESVNNQAIISKAFQVSFQAKELGWYNVDHFYNDPSAKPVEFFVDVDQDSLDFCDVTLILPRLNASISAVPEGNGRYNFSKETGGKSILPLGQYVILVAMSSKNHVYYFFQQQIQIAEKQTIKVKLEKMDQAELDSALVNLFKPGVG
jgi:hypothetical protein